jgi:hypothetical protein
MEEALNMTIKEFAARHKVRIKLDELADPIVIAKHGQIYEYGPGQFGVMFLTDSVGKWNNRRKECEAAGMKLIQDGDTEGTLLFDPENLAQAKTAIRTVGARFRRQVSPETAKAGAERLARFREAKKAASDPSTEAQNRP